MLIYIGLHEKNQLMGQLQQRLAYVIHYTLA